MTGCEPLHSYSVCCSSLLTKASSSRAASLLSAPSQPPMGPPPPTPPLKPPEPAPVVLPPRGAAGTPVRCSNLCTCVTVCVLGGGNFIGALLRPNVQEAAAAGPHATTTFWQVHTSIRQFESSFPLITNQLFCGLAHRCGRRAALAPSTPPSYHALCTRIMLQWLQYSFKLLWPHPCCRRRRCCRHPAPAPPPPPHLTTHSHATYTHTHTRQ